MSNKRRSSKKGNSKKPTITITLPQADEIRVHMAIMYTLAEGACSYMTLGNEEVESFLISNAIIEHCRRFEKLLRPIVGCGFY